MCKKVLMSVADESRRDNNEVRATECPKSEGIRGE